MTSHLTTLDVVFIAGPGILFVIAVFVGLVVAIVQDIRESRIY